MRVLFVSNNFPPEVNALANRVYEHARQWSADGGSVEVLTDIPNYPEGIVYQGYRNRFTRERVDGIDVMRVPMYVAANRGRNRRTISYITFMFSAVLYSWRTRVRPDVVVASSPQLFSALAGMFISWLRRKRFVLEIRDLWPESIVAVGALPRNRVIRVLEWIEMLLYRKADHIVVVTNTFKKVIAEKGIDPSKISVLKNGVDLARFEEPLDPALLDEIKERYDLAGKFVVSYIGTIGMAHRLEVLFEAARRCTDPDVVFMVVGTGAERDQLMALQEEHQLPNFRLVDKQPRELIPYFLKLTDVSVVHLMDIPLFRTVIPSKLFEAMGMEKPIILGVEGEAREVVEESGSGITVKPEDPEAILQAALRLRYDPDLYQRMAQNGKRYAHDQHDRETLARRYWALLEQIAGLSPVHDPARTQTEFHVEKVSAST